MTDTYQMKMVAEAIHNRLSTDLSVQAILGDPPRLYDSAPEDPEFPYLTYGVMRAEDRSGDATRLTDHKMSLHVWSRYAGRLETFDILKALSIALEQSPLSLSDGQIATIVIPYVDVVRAPDGRTVHGLLRLHAFTQTAEVVA